MKERWSSGVGKVMKRVGKVGSDIVLAFDKENKEP
jgi:hypothetical protein